MSRKPHQSHIAPAHTERAGLFNQLHHTSQAFDPAETQKSYHISDEVGTRSIVAKRLSDSFFPGLKTSKLEGYKGSCV